MRKVFAIAAMGLLVLTLPSIAAVPALSDGQDFELATGPRTGASPPCPGTVLWDTGMYDAFLPAPCSSAFSAGCMVNADTTGVTFGTGRRTCRLGADDFLALTADPITHIKVWLRANAGAEELGFIGDTPTPLLHGFTINFYEAYKVLGSWFCPDGSLPGESFIGPMVYEGYTSDFALHYISGVGGLTRNWAACIALPYPAFYPVAGKWYWVSVAPDFDFQPGVTAYSQIFWRAYPGNHLSHCEVEWWDGWNEGLSSAWTPLSIAINLPCWATWDAAFILYSGIPPVATEPTTWGKIKANYR